MFCVTYFVVVVLCANLVAPFCLGTLGGGQENAIAFPVGFQQCAPLPSTTVTLVEQ